MYSLHDGAVHPIRDQRVPLIDVTDLQTYFFLSQGVVRAVDGVSFRVHRGEILGVVGESGCGKSVMVRSLIRIVTKPGRLVGGRILYHRPTGTNRAGETTETMDLATFDPTGREIRKIRGAEISMVFQEPMTSLSPVHTIGNQIMEAILLHRSVTSDQARHIAIDMLEKVGMSQPGYTIDRYPHQLSGGMRQRAMIAMALSCRPNLLIADEPTTALDVTTQAQILTLMRALQQELGMAILFITHDLGVIAQMTSHVIVMYLGKVVESAPVRDIFYTPKHPYTQALLQSIPLVKRDPTERLTAIRGTVPDPYSIPAGCPFHPRCQFNDNDRCVSETPDLREIAPNHFAGCHYADQLELVGISPPEIPVATGRRAPVGP